MTVKEVKQILGEARQAGLKYKELRDKAQRYEQRLSGGKGVRYESDGCVHERDGSSVERGLCAAADHSAEADRAAQDFHRSYIKAGRLIYLVKDGKQRDVLNRRYLLCRSWGRIAREMNVSRRHVFRLHDKALEIISKKFLENY